jgi:protein-S-isoprenylcysteine O-methyltransferase Ste14
MDIAATTVGGHLKLRLANAAASAVIVILASAAIWFAPYHHEVLAETYYGPPLLEFTGYGFLLGAAAAYILLLTVYYSLEHAPGISKSLRCLKIAADFARAPADSLRNGLTQTDRLAVLSTLLKFFFGPMMTVWLMVHCMGAWANGARILDAGFDAGGVRPFFDEFGYWFLMQVILFVDVLLFTVGYLVELPRLGNEIRSVDPTLLGWAAALLCYPPFNQITGWVIGSQVSDFPRFDDPTVHLALNLLLLALMAIYASASVALGLKASNLTHRGIVARGPYAVVRHPAYVCKNMAWWIGSAPLVTASFDQSLITGLLSIGSVVAWSLLYALRALTEEDHLRRVDGAYGEYAAKVRYRFIPGLL